MSDAPDPEREKIEQEIRARVEKFAAERGYVLYPDPKIVDTVIRGMAKRKLKFGEAYCPCRIMAGDPEVDKKIICPCEPHVEELEQHGVCHCRLVATPEFAANYETNEG